MQRFSMGALSASGAMDMADVFLGVVALALVILVVGLILLSRANDHAMHQSLGNRDEPGLRGRGR